jgi:hypothetical protein
MIADVMKAMLDLLQENFKGGLREIYSVVIAGHLLFHFEGAKRIILSS